jgi:hypothetical protein
MDPDPDPAIFIIDLQDANKKLSLKKVDPDPGGPRTYGSDRTRIRNTQK